MKDLLHSLLYLKGIYSMDELPLIYIMSNMPYEYDARLFSAMTTAEMSVADAVLFLHTLRLYLVLRNITDVSKLMGIHVNSCKFSEVPSHESAAVYGNRRRHPAQ